MFLLFYSYLSSLFVYCCCCHFRISHTTTRRIMDNSWLSCLACEQMRGGTEQGQRQMQSGGGSGRWAIADEDGGLIGGNDEIWGWIGVRWRMVDSLPWWRLAVSCWLDGSVNSPLFFVWKIFKNKMILDLFQQSACNAWAVIKIQSCLFVPLSLRRKVLYYT